MRDFINTNYHVGRGAEIENESFSIIDREAGEHKFNELQWSVVRRMIHTTADFEYKNLTYFSPNALEFGVKAICNRAPIFCDVKMIKYGLNQSRLSIFGNQVFCYVDDEDVILSAQKNKTTRAQEAVRKAYAQNLFAEHKNLIVAVGNAPTFLLEVLELVKENLIRPSLVVGMPVGFVSAAESKEKLLEISKKKAVIHNYPKKEEVEYLPTILTQGRKGGSPLVVAVLHALIKLATASAG